MGAWIEEYYAEHDRVGTDGDARGPQSIGDLDGEVQVRDHPLNNDRLLRILLTKKCKVGSDSIKKHRNHRSDTTKVARSRSAFELLGKTFNSHIRRKALRINLFNRRCKNVIDVVIGQQRGIFS